MKVIGFRVPVVLLSLSVLLAACMAPSSLSFDIRYLETEDTYCQDKDNYLNFGFYLEGGPITALALYWLPDGVSPRSENPSLVLERVYYPGINQGWLYVSPEGILGGGASPQGVTVEPTVYRLWVRGYAYGDWSPLTPSVNPVRLVYCSP